MRARGRQFLRVCKRDAPSLAVWLIVDAHYQCLVSRHETHSRLLSDMRVGPCATHLHNTMRSRFCQTHAGRAEKGHVAPIPLLMKAARSGLGVDEAKRAAERERADARDREAAKRARLEEDGKALFMQVCLCVSVCAWSLTVEAGTCAVVFDRVLDMCTCFVRSLHVSCMQKDLCMYLDMCTSAVYPCNAPPPTTTHTYTHAHTPQEQRRDFATRQALRSLQLAWKAAEQLDLAEGPMGHARGASLWKQLTALHPPPSVDTAEEEVDNTNRQTAEGSGRRLAGDSTLLLQGGGADGAGEMLHSVRAAAAIGGEQEEEAAWVPGDAPYVRPRLGVGAEAAHIRSRSPVQHSLTQAAHSSDIVRVQAGSAGGIEDMLQGTASSEPEGTSTQAVSVTQPQPLAALSCLVPFVVTPQHNTHTTTQSSRGASASRPAAIQSIPTCLVRQQTGAMAAEAAALAGTMLGQPSVLAGAMRAPPADLEALEQAIQSPLHCDTAGVIASQQLPDYLIEPLSVSDQLQLAVGYLRSEHCYCLFCGCQYGSDGEMAIQCPGPFEDLH